MKNTKSGTLSGAALFSSTIVFQVRLDLLDVRGLGTLGSFGDLEGYRLALGEGLEAIALDRAEMHENILAVVGGDESIPLSVVEPFYCAL